MPHEQIIFPANLLEPAISLDRYGTLLWNTDYTGVYRTKLARSMNLFLFCRHAIPPSPVGVVLGYAVAIGGHACKVVLSFESPLCCRQALPVQRLGVGLRCDLALRRTSDLVKLDDEQHHSRLLYSSHEK